MKNYYEILQVNEKASKEVISKVYKMLAKKYHPDANPDNKEESAEKFKEISEAYEILSNEEKRSEYDKELENFKTTSQGQTVSLEEFLALQNYCKELEQQINAYSFQSNNNYNNNYQNSNYNHNDYQTQNVNDNANNYQSQNINNDYAYEKAQEKAYHDAINKAYHDAYINNLKNMGYKIRYKKTFKDYFKSIITLVITAVIIFIILKIIWAIPTAKEWFLGLFRI